MRAMNFAAIRPGRPPPKVTPVNIRTTMVARARFGANSLISATMIGSVPASAMPVRMRVRTSWLSDEVATAASVNRPKAIGASDDDALPAETVGEIAEERRPEEAGGERT